MALILALLTAISTWLSLGTLAVYSGDTNRIAALPSLWILAILAVAAVAAARFARLRLEQAWPLAISLLLWLPFLPGSVPPSFAMWEGPIEGVVWLCVIAGVVAASAPSLPQPLTDPRTTPWLAALLLMVGWLAAFSQVRAVIPGGDEPHYLAATQSLLHDGDLRVANNYANGEYLEYFPGRLEPHFLKRSSSGEIYSIHSPGVSVIVLPAFAIAGYVGAVTMMTLIAALTAFVTWRLAFRVSGSLGGAWAGTLAVFATAPYFFHAFTIYPEVIGSSCFIIGVSLLVDLAEARQIGSPRLIAVGGALAVLPWLHSRFALIAAMLGVLIVIRLIERRAIASVGKFLLVPAIAGAAWFTFFYLIWGSPSPAAPYGPDTSTSLSYVLRGWIGLLVDQQFGVLTTAPVYVAAIAGLWPLFQRQPRLTVELLLAAIVYAIAVASYAMWWGGAAAPARFIVSVLPIAAVSIAVLWDRSRVIVGLLLLVSIALIVPRALVDSGRFIYNNRNSFDATLQWLTSSVDLPSALPSVHATGGAIAVRDAAIWLAGLAVAAAFVTIVARHWRTGARFALTTFVFAVAVMTCARVAWSFDQFSVSDWSRSQVSALERFRPAWQTMFIDGSWRRRSGEDLIRHMALTFYMKRSISIGRVAAGQYELIAGDSPATSDPVAIHVGRNDPAIEQPALSVLRDPQTPFRFRLPVTVRNLNFRIDSAASVGGSELRLRPIAVVPAASGRAATGAARFGRARVFVFDESAYLERDGFWTRANGSADVVIDTQDDTRSSGLTISITAGLVATTIELSIGSLPQSFSLAPGQQQELVLPPSESGVWPLRIRSGAGFRPSEREPGSRDVRLLAAWIAIR